MTSSPLRRDRLVRREGQRHKGIAIAEARANAPRLVRPGHVWSREEVLAWLLERAAKEPTLFGFDFSFAPPLIERGEYLPGEPDVPTTAREFWAYVDRAERRRGPRRRELP